MPVECGIILAWTEQKVKEKFSKMGVRLMKKCLSVAELIEYLGCDRGTAYALVKTSGFPAARIGKRIVIPEDALKEWLANGGTKQKGA